jgi:GTP 3',8-cyclase
MPEEDISCTTRENLMSVNEIESIAKVFVDLGINKIRLTGGEPLVRKEAKAIIEKLSALPVDLTMTTNGLRVDEFLDTFKKAGIRSLNISLDTLDSDRFYLLTRRNLFQKVKDNIQLLLDHDFHVKVNVVVMRGINDQEILDFIDWSIKEPVHIRFIEFMPFAGNTWHGDKVFPLDDILIRIAEKYDFIPLLKEKNATASKYFIPNAKGTFAIIGTMTHPFCGDCNRLRLTADGKMKNCLFSNGESDILGAARKGEDIVPLIKDNLLKKMEKLGGQLDGDYLKINADHLHNRSMISIGG